MPAGLAGLFNREGTKQIWDGADSTLLAFSMSPREDTPSDIWLAEPVAGAQPRQLIRSPGADTKPAISPLDRLSVGRLRTCGSLSGYMP